MTSVLGCCINQDDIQNANNDLGSFAMLEEIAKTAIMFNSFRFTFKYGKKFINNSIMTGAIYKPDKTKNLLYLKTPITMTSTLSAGCQIKPVLDSLWETEYEKSLEKHK